jgi:hypothetical protein
MKIISAIPNNTFWGPRVYTVKKTFEVKFVHGIFVKDTDSQEDNFTKLLGKLLNEESGLFLPSPSVLHTRTRLFTDKFTRITVAYY